MARLADYCPNSDDEGPEVSSYLKQSSGNIMRTPKALSKTPGRALVPKSAIPPSTRKVRRLRDVSSQIGLNPLFKKWDGAEEESPRKSPTKARQSVRKMQSSFEESDFEPALVPSTILRTRPQRSKGNSKSKSDSDDSDVFGGNGTPEIKLHGASLEAHCRDITVADTTQSTQATADKSSFAESESSMRVDEQDHRAASAQDGEENVQATQIMESPPASPCPPAVASAIKEETDAELLEDSATSAATDESTDYSNNTYSDFDSFDTTGSVGNRTTAKLLFQKRPDLSASKAPASTAQDETVLSEVKNATIVEDIGEMSETDELIQNMLDLQLQDSIVSARRPVTPTLPERPSTPPAQEEPAPVVPAKLDSPTKKSKIPQTPHRPSSDAFWSQDATNEWNDQHSPRKLILPKLSQSPTKASPKKAVRQAFDAQKHQLAEEFLAELDAQITEGQIASLAESTGGVKLVWSKTLKTTAGRANWKRETIRNKHADGTTSEARYKHYASIELAEKVIDDEARLLNTMAHEFCHLANFMVNGLTTNPHGKEFKVWANKCSRTFAHRGIKVTTKHTYEIDFKYVWECLECGNEHKRHSRSIDPARHRCGTCKGSLKQTRPTPRAGGQPSQYQIFVKEQMKVVKAENPGVKQKEVMKLVAEKWALRNKEKTEEQKEEQEQVDGVVEEMVDLTLEQ